MLSGLFLAALLQCMAFVVKANEVNMMQNSEGINRNFDTSNAWEPIRYENHHDFVDNVKQDVILNQPPPFLNHLEHHQGFNVDEGHEGAITHFTNYENNYGPKDLDTQTSLKYPFLESLNHQGIHESLPDPIPIRQHIEVTNPIAVPDIKHVPVPFKKPVHISVPYPVIVPVPQPYPVKVPVYKPVPVPVVKEYQVPIEKIQPYPVVKNIPIPVQKAVPYSVEKEVKVKVPKPYPVPVPIVKPLYYDSKDHGFDSHHHQSSKSNYFDFDEHHGGSSDFDTDDFNTHDYDIGSHDFNFSKANKELGNEHKHSGGFGYRRPKSFSSHFNSRPKGNKYGIKIKKRGNSYGYRAGNSRSHGGYYMPRHLGRTEYYY